jgi:hypothetical protein
LCAYILYILVLAESGHMEDELYIARYFGRSLVRWDMGQKPFISNMYCIQLFATVLYTGLVLVSYISTWARVWAGVIHVPLYGSTSALSKTLTVAAPSHPISQAAAGADSSGGTSRRFCGQQRSSGAGPEPEEET